MDITRNNYELYFLDYFEGALDTVQVDLLMAFLEAHPDLKDEFESFRMVTLSDDQAVNLGDKGFLKKELITPENSDHFFAAYVEGDLNAAQRSETEAFVAASPGMGRELELMKKTVLTPDTSIQFPRKSALKHHTLGMMTQKLWRVTSVAAAVLIMAGLFFTWNPGDSRRDMLVTLPAPFEALDPWPLPAERTPTPDAVAPQPESPVATPTPSPARRQPVVSPVMPEPLLASRLSAKSSGVLAAPAVSTQETVSPRSEFAYWSAVGRQDDYFGEEPMAPSGQQPSRASALASLALNRLQRSIPDEVREVEEQISGGRLSLWDIAGMGLASISNATGISLNVEQERDESGRLVQFAVGDAFEYRRR
jgi:hypothetical protein